MSEARRVPLRVEVHDVPDPGLIRPAVEAALLGLPWPSGPEAAIAAAVAEHVGTRPPATEGAAP